MRGVNRHGTGPTASIVVAREMLSSAVPGQVVDLTAARIERYKYRLTWTRPANCNHQDPVTAYHIFYDSCTNLNFVQAWQPTRSEQNQMDFSITLTYSQSSGDSFAMPAENSAGIGYCKMGTRE